MVVTLLTDWLRTGENAHRLMLACRLYLARSLRGRPQRAMVTTAATADTSLLFSKENC